MMVHPSSSTKFQLTGLENLCQGMSRSFLVGWRKGRKGLNIPWKILEVNGSRWEKKQKSSNIPWSIFQHAMFDTQMVRCHQSLRVEMKLISWIHRFLLKFWWVDVVFGQMSISWLVEVEFLRLPEAADSIPGESADYTSHFVEQNTFSGLNDCFMMLYYLYLYYFMFYDC